MNLPEQAAEYAMDRALTPAQITALSRAFMSGAQQALVALKNGATHEQLMADVLGFGRAVGTAAEGAFGLPCKGADRKGADRSGMARRGRAG